MHLLNSCDVSGPGRGISSRSRVKESNPERGRPTRKLLLSQGGPPVSMMDQNAVTGLSDGGEEMGRKREGLACPHQP
jgi:hypothetical protein